MPPKPGRQLNRGWSAFEAPILPFLAPRVFAPWPSRCRTAHSSTRALPIHNRGVGDHKISQLVGKELSSRRKFAHGSSLRAGIPSARDGEIHTHNLVPSTNPSQPASLDPGRTQVFANSDLELPEVETFKTKYEGIWDHIDESKVPISTPMQDTKLDKREFASINELDTPLQPIHKDGTTFNPHDELGNDSKDISRTWEQTLRRRRKALKLNRTLVQQFKIPRERTKWVSWSPDKRSYMLKWEKRFALLDVRHQNYHPDLKFIDNTKKRFTEESMKDLIEQESSISLRKMWDTIPKGEQYELWPELMMTVLDKHPNAAVKVLAATYTAPYPPNYAVSDCINFITSHFFQNQESPEHGQVGKIYSVVTYLLHKSPGQRLVLSQHAIYLLVKHLETIQVKAFYELLGDTGQPFSTNTLMQFTYRLSNSGDTDLAFEILQRISREGGDFNSRKLKSVCTNLLEKNGRSSNTGLSDSQIFEFLLGCGMKPNRGTYKILLQNSFESRDDRNGWKIYNMMKADGIKAGGFVYSLLLNDSKMRMDHSAIAHLVEVIRETRVKNAHIGTDILHAIFLLSANEKRISLTDHLQETPTAFERMLPVYCKYFHLQPLSEIIHDFSTRFGHLVPKDGIESKSLLVPRSQTLVVMLTAFLKDSRPESTINQYKWFRRLVLNGNPAVSELLQSTHTYNLFVKALAESFNTLDWCPRIVRDMISSAKPAAEQKEAPSSINTARPGAPASHGKPRNGQSLADVNDSEHPQGSVAGPAPDVYTWSILLNAFLSHGQTKAAEKVLTMMTSRGITPNHVSWNSLVAGYARLQDIDMMVDAVDRMEAAGFQTDEYTMSSMSRIRHYRALITAMAAKELKREQSPPQMDPEDSERSQILQETLDKALLDDKDRLLAEASMKYRDLDVLHPRHHRSFRKIFLDTTPQVKTSHV